MKLSINFLKDYVDVNEDVKTLAEDMTRVGNEYESAGSNTKSGIRTVESTVSIVLLLLSSKAAE